MSGNLPSADTVERDGADSGASAPIKDAAEDVAAITDTPPPPPVVSADTEDAADQELAHKLRIADRRLKQAEMLLNVSRRVAGIESLDEVLETLVEVIVYELEAERGTLFLNDPATGELYSRVAQGNFQREIRILNNTGIAGAVFSSGNGEIIDDAYQDGRFNRSVDEQTGFKTDTICAAR